jgi:hypothetical protein
MLRNYPIKASHLRLFGVKNSGARRVTEEGSKRVTLMNSWSDDLLIPQAALFQREVALRFTHDA